MVAGSERAGHVAPREAAGPATPPMDPDPRTDDIEEPTLIRGRGDPLNMIARLPLLAGLPQELVLAAAAELEWISLPGGTELFAAGEQADAVYFVISGCLGAVDRDGRLRGRIAAGESVGEMALIADQPRTATVRALRDSDVARLPAAAFRRLLLGNPEAMLRLARLTVARLTASGRARPAAGPRTFTLVPQDPGTETDGVAAQLVAALGAWGRVELVRDERGRDHTSQWFHRVESQADFVVYVAGPGESAWTRLCVRQADVLLLLAGAAAIPTRPGWLAGTRGATDRAELLLLHGRSFSSGRAAAWQSTLPGVAVHHVRGPGDVARVARLMTGRALGLVLSGGGARGFAHLGVIRALRERGVSIDLVGGSSIGAVLGAGAAVGWDDGEMVRHFRRSFVDTNPLDDYTLPLLSLVAGRKVGRLLRREFGEVAIEDLPLPFFCVSANLTSGRVAVHDRGLLWRWLRASIAIPGVLPPVFSGGEVFVDGGTMNNLPVDVMRGLRRGPVIGVDVGADPVFTTDVEATEAPPWWKFVLRRGDRPKRPNIVQILLRSGMVNSAAASAEHRQLSDLLLTPPLERIDLLDWQAFDRALEIGYRCAAEALDAGALAEVL